MVPSKTKRVKLRMFFKALRLACHLIVALMVITAVQVGEGSRVIRRMRTRNCPNVYCVPMEPVEIDLKYSDSSTFSVRMIGNDREPKSQRTQPQGGVKAFSVYRTSDWNDDGTITYDGVDVDTTGGFIEQATGHFVAPDTGVYRFTFTGQIYCPAGSNCNGKIMLRTDDKIIAASHEVNC